jgi:hypothetical protein
MGSTNGMRSSGGLRGIIEIDTMRLTDTSTKPYVNVRNSIGFWMLRTKNSRVVDQIIRKIGMETSTAGRKSST